MSLFGEIQTINIFLPLNFQYFSLTLKHKLPPLSVKLKIKHSFPQVIDSLQV